MRWPANDPKLALSNFDYATMLTESILLGNAAMKAGKKLEYDGEKGAFSNAEECNKLLSREYRTGWKLVVVLIAGKEEQLVPILVKICARDQNRATDVAAGEVES